VQAIAEPIADELQKEFVGLPNNTAGAACGTALIDTGIMVVASSLGIPCIVRGSRFRREVAELRAALFAGLKKLHDEIVADPREAVAVLASSNH
jgi:hypothetical protein